MSKRLPPALAGKFAGDPFPLAACGASVFTQCLPLARRIRSTQATNCRLCNTSLAHDPFGPLSFCPLLSLS